MQRDLLLDLLRYLAHPEGPRVTIENGQVEADKVLAVADRLPGEFSQRSGTNTWPIRRWPTRSVTAFYIMLIGSS